MPVVHFIQPNNSEQTVEVPAGTSAMLAAVQAAVPGIVAECGGAAMCGTCHVYVDEAFLDRLTPADPVEQEILEAMLTNCRHNSRLSCQISISQAVDGLVLHLPPA
ncbi:2Fe-2S iron-sulfur cluster-binding protein [Paraburkholderia oxyphila]|uniref:2Fe-2S iron-sulfur cluster-binding protein n=1 Tax=Paraburkholderia oxyphila TaxID=614212 RepID=UPI00048494EA|nr:2Fe-2S iron-sulfur cluster-binding protein [Paraburkholderia oxyphila]